MATPQRIRPSRELTMKILAIDRPLPGATPEKYQPHLLNEARHAWQSYKKGFIREINFRLDHPGVATILECESVEAAKMLLAEFPLVKAGVIEFEVIPIGPFANWEALFAPENK
jgi:hypothetical protein